MDNCLVVTQGLLEGFKEWLLREQGTSEGTVRKYMYYLPRIHGMALCGKQDVSQAFEWMKLTKVSYEAFSRLLTYVEKKLEGYEDLVAKLRKAMPKKPKTREDTYVPPDTRVLEAYRCLEERFGEPYTLFFLVLAYTGLRGTEARYLLENADKLHAVELGYLAVKSVRNRQGKRYRYPVWRIPGKKDIYLEGQEAEEILRLREERRRLEYNIIISIGNLSGQPSYTCATSRNTRTHA